MSKLSKRHFWEWFNRNNKEFLELNKKTKKEESYWLSELNAHLRAYFKFLSFSVTLNDKKTPALTITVNGKVQHFQKVDAFVATAPEIPGWRIVALEEPMPIDFLMEKQIEQAGIHPQEFYFSFEDNDPEDPVIVIYHPLCTEENEHTLLKLANAAVYNLLGERTFGLDIQYLEVANLSSADPKHLQKLEELPASLGSRSSAMMIDPDGRLLSMY